MGLQGLTPEEIGAISGRRISRESERNQMMKRVADYLGTMQEIEASKASQSLTETRQLGLEKGMEEVEVTYGGKPFKFMKKDFAASLKALVDAGDKEAMSNTIPMEYNGKPYNIPLKAVQHIANAEKIRATEATALEERERVIAARETLGKRTPAELGGASATDIETAGMASAIPSLITEAGKVERAAKEPALTSDEIRKFQDQQMTLEKIIDTKMVGKRKVKKPLGHIRLYNANAVKVGSNIMYYWNPKTVYRKGPNVWAGDVKVTLPKGISPAKVAEMAESNGVTIEEALRQLHMKILGD